MKIFKKIGIFVIIAVLLVSLLSLVVFATDAVSGESSESVTEVEDDGKLDMSLKPKSFSEGLEYAIQGTVTGMLMVFAVLILLTVILYISKYIFYDIPNKNKEATRPVETAESVAPAKPVAATATPAPAVEAASAPAAQDDGELAAVITAAIAAMIESGDYKNEFVGGFRVVSFKRSTQSAWNRK